MTTHIKRIRIRFITRLRVGLSHLCGHKFKLDFQDCLNPICSCCLDIESTSHFLLHCPIFNDERYTLLSTLEKYFFFVTAIYQAQNFTLVLPLHEKNEYKPLNIKDLDGTHFVPL